MGNSIFMISFLIASNTFFTFHPLKCKYERIKTFFGKKRCRGFEDHFMILVSGISILNLLVYVVFVRWPEVWTHWRIISSSNILEPDCDASTSTSSAAGIHQCYNNATPLWIWRISILPWSWHDGRGFSGVHHTHVSGTCRRDWLVRLIFTL